jgi:hypothetical protein
MAPTEEKVEEKKVPQDTICCWCDSAPCKKKAEAAAMVDSTLGVTDVAGIVSGYMGNDGTDCWSCSRTGEYLFCHCEEKSRSTILASPTVIKNFRVNSLNNFFFF